MESMRAIRKMKAGPGFDLVEMEVPKPGAGELLVKVKATSMCGTDLHIYNWEPPWSTGRFQPPKTIGHEVCGEIVGLGDRVSSFEEGDLVSAESHIYDNTCSQCLQGNKHICENIGFFSIDTEGFWADYALLPEKNAWKSNGMKPEIATLQESMGNSVYTVKEADVKDKFVAIFGMGPTGLFATGIAKAMGARTVAVVGGTNVHLDIAKAMGADILINRHEKDPVKEILELTEGRGADSVLEMSGAVQAIQQSLESVRPVGKLCVLGLPTKPVTIDVSKMIVLKDLDFRGIYGRRIWDTWEATKSLLDKGLDISPVITHRLALEEWEQGVEAMKSGQSGKVVMFPE